MTTTRARRFGVPLAMRAGVWVAAIATALGLLVAASPVNATTAPPAVGADIVKTADLSKFQAGNIMSDGVFFNSNTMSPAQIQSFLESKVPTCQAGYTCLKDWYDTSRSTTADAMCGAYSGGYAERASTIIYKVAQACGINPQVILATLQKEQGLVTHVWPSEWRYTIAMGQGCPDTAACDTRYYGFFNQVYGAAWQFKRYANPPGTSNYFNWYAPGKTWNVRWHPNAACGSSPVYIQNQATANLYYYTPYQPNAAAIRAGYGEGDGCSSYGNRNFYQYFMDWFGTTPPPELTSVDTSSYVLALDGSGSVWGYPFRGGDGWGDAVKVATVAAGTTRILSVGDFDGDGRRDIIGVEGNGAATLYSGDGARGFGNPRKLAVDWSGAKLITAAGDFDGDGAPDVFTTDASGYLLLWRGTGFGEFRTPVIAGNGWGGMSLLSGGTDMDQDGAVDLVARTASGSLFLYSGNGSGGWRGSTAIGNGWAGMSAILSPGDFSGDKVPDILARDSAGNLLQYTGSGGGRIAGGNRVGNGWQSLLDIVGTGPAVTAARVRPAGAGDIDGDRAPDVLATTVSGQLLAYQGNGAGSWRGSFIVDPSWGANTKFITLGDFTGDGIADLGRLNPDGTLDLLRGRGDGTYQPASRIGNGWNTLSMVIGGIDFDGDRKTDLIGRDSAGNLLLYRGDGKGGWAADPVIIGFGWNMMNSIFYAGDFDGDGAGDIIARSADGNLWLYPTTGSGSWKDARQIGYAWTGFDTIFSPGNFDGTGGPDVLARTPGGQLYLYRGDGRGGWTSGTMIGQGWSGMRQIG
jgi:hypothetical protein